MLLSLIIGILIGALFTGLIIWIVSKLGLGLEVTGFGTPAFIAAIVIAILNGIVTWLLGLLGINMGGGGSFVNVIGAGDGRGGRATRAQARRHVRSTRAAPPSRPPSGP